MTLRNLKTGNEPVSRMNYLLSHNPTGELIYYLSRLYKVQKRKRKNF